MHTLTFQTLRERFGSPYFVKIDIEGFDAKVIEQLSWSDARPRFVSVENGWPNLLERLVALGYRGFKFINQARVPELRCPTPAREGLTIEWAFPWSSSGPFGEDTPGEWKGAAEILVDIEVYWKNPARDPAVDGWYDLHARHGDS